MIRVRVSIGPVALLLGLIPVVAAGQDMSGEEFAAKDGPENPRTIHAELGDVMTRNVTVVRYNKNLEETLAKMRAIDGILSVRVMPTRWPFTTRWIPPRPPNPRPTHASGATD